MAYFANGSEGEVLDAQCAACPLGDKPCPVALVQLLYNYDQVGVPKLREAMNCLVGADGLCRLRPLIVGLAGQ